MAQQRSGPGGGGHDLEGCAWGTVYNDSWKCSRLEVQQNFCLRKFWIRSILKHACLPISHAAGCNTVVPSPGSSPSFLLQQSSGHVECGMCVCRNEYGQVDVCMCVVCVERGGGRCE